MFNLEAYMQKQQKTRAQRMAEEYPKKLEEMGVIKQQRLKRPQQPQLAADGTVNWWATILNLPQGGEDAD